MTKLKVKQRDITDCGAACLLSVSRFYGADFSVAKIRQLASTDQKGTNLLGLIEAAKKLGFDAKGVKGDMDALPDATFPSIAHVVLENGLHHFVVITKIDKKEVIVMDPGDGQYHHYSLTDFEKIWSGVLVLITPSISFEKKNETISIKSRFYELISVHKSVVLQAIIGALVFTILGLSTSVYIQKIIDYVLVDGNRNLLWLLSVGMIVILVFQTIIGYFKSQLILRTGQMIDARLILGYYQHLIKLPQQFFDTMRVGEIVSRINDAVKIRAFINDSAISLIINICILIFSFVAMFIYSWKLALIMLLLLPVSGGIYWFVNYRNKKYQRKLMESSAELESQLVESIDAIRTIKRMGTEDFSNLKTEIRFVDTLKNVFSISQTNIISENSTHFVSIIFTVIVLGVGANFVLAKELTPGELLSFNALLNYLTGPVAALIGMNAQWQNAKIAADRLFELLDLDNEQSNTNEEQIILTPKKVGDIQLQNISFRYGSKVDVFKNLNLKIPKGKLTAIVGESGSGKSTIAALIQKIYPIQEGQILIGDININYITKKSLRNMIGVVPQQIELFKGSVIENIALGELKPNVEKVISICKELGIISFIESLPNGFQTEIGEKGSTLSGGQRQRLAIARALYKNPEVLILDEPTASLDSKSEQYVQEVIHQLIVQGKTIIIIAHRLSTIQHADKIIVLDKGKLVEEGIHFELLEQNGKYNDLWESQMPRELKELTV
ncbi:peptidase domain-containing ABC transporter [Flammeovirga kamogawensis]|uniref:Peptidase domain-containing ABC transporter n=2 Tax=Flammeovirga kamogawensis TaxID=373891 RepID=A0ABX8H004_9BACT|nr:peptidase domain-containing ABC transporter [Flammeovirga kamogawensis]QWG09208.1 peptidase domain-containing ABC transporter [Flammeovirga kamogawensis]TRX70126.1 peptidase domain-containing ABC transporter [Flammeovirga kamogawensis]